MGTSSPSAEFICGDFFKIYKERFFFNSVDCIITSPDYNMGVSAKKRSKLLYLNDFILLFGVAVDKLLSREGSLFLNFGYPPSDPLWPLEVIHVLVEASGFVLQNVIHWVKTVSITDPKSGAVRSHGHFKPINSRRYLNSGHEYVFHLTRDGKIPLDRLAIGVPYQDPSNLKRWEASRERGVNLRCRGDVWHIPYITIQSREKDRPHAATFPVELPLNCLKLRGLDKTQLVLDPFCGLGSTNIAAGRLGIGSVGVDIVQDHVDYARERYAREVGNGEV